MTVINKVNDDSESYFSDIGLFCFIIQCCHGFLCNSMILSFFFFILIIGAIFLTLACFVKVP